MGGYERVFDLPCGEGDKSFKWLSNCASQRLASCAPDGSLRRKEGLRGTTKSAQPTAAIIILANGDSPHPASRICDFLVDGETVTVKMVDTMDCGFDGNPKQSEWATLAFTTNSPMGSLGEMKDDSFIEDYIGLYQCECCTRVEFLD